MYISVHAILHEYQPLCVHAQDNHNATLGKLNFVLDLVECILEVARSRGAPLSAFSESVSVKQGEQLSDQVHRKLLVPSCGYMFFFKQYKYYCL